MFACILLEAVPLFFFVFEDLLKLKFQMLISVSVERW